MARSTRDPYRMLQRKRVTENGVVRRPEARCPWLPNNARPDRRVYGASRQTQEGLLLGVNIDFVAIELAGGLLTFSAMLRGKW